MGRFIMYPITIQGGLTVKAYIDFTNQTAVIFPNFGRYYKLSADKNILDFVIAFLPVHAENTEDTVEIDLSQFDKAA